MHSFARYCTKMQMRYQSGQGDTAWSRPADSTRRLTAPLRNDWIARRMDGRHACRVATSLNWPFAGSSTSSITGSFNSNCRVETVSSNGTGERFRQTISLFSGAMGLDLGLEAAGLSTGLTLECNKFAVRTIKRNRPSLPLIAKRIEDVGSEEILERSGLQVGEAFAVVGGPSCQVFSTAGQRKSLGDPRSNMFRHFVRVIRDTQPKFFLMENVRGLISAAVRHRPLGQRGPGHLPLREDEQLGSAFAVVAADLRSLGYYCVFDVLNTADYGVPQTRQRLVILGSRDGRRLQMPPPTHSMRESDRLPEWRTLGETMEDVRTGEDDFYTFCPSKAEYLRLVPEGGNWRDLPEDLKRKALGSAYDSWGGRSGFFRRLSRSRPSPALTTRPDSKATSLCHPTELRPLSVPEYAAIQEFPPDWVFEGPIRKRYEQVGNAMPTGLGEALGRALRAAEATTVDEARLGNIILAVPSRMM